MLLLILICTADIADVAAADADAVSRSSTLIGYTKLTIFKD